MFVRAAGSAFHWPAMTASTPLVVPRERLPRVAGLNQASGGTVNIVSPPLGALLLSVLPIYGIMAIDVVTAAFAITPLLFIAIPQPPRAAQGAGVLLVGITPASFFPLALIGLFFGAVMNSMSNAALFALLQQAIAPEMQGRVFALGRSLAGAAMPLGMALAGPLADAVGVRPLYVGSGILYILVGAGAFLVPVLVHIEGEQGVHAPAEGKAPGVAALPAGAELLPRQEPG